MLSFTKMHGAGNDFIIVDNRSKTFPSKAIEWMQRIGTRKTGIGCDGFVLIERPKEVGNFRMRFFNPDGHEAEMCGNGARCVARFAFDRDIAPARMSFETVAGLIKAEVLEDGQVCIALPPPSRWDEDLVIPEIMGDVKGHWITSGVPHLVFPVDDLKRFEVVLKGRKLRWHKLFQPAGTNADFFAVEDDGVLGIRTYERGVENETLACGTGMIATALCAYRMGVVRPPVTLRCAGGDRLVVDFSMNKITEVKLTGPAVYVYEGSLPDPVGPILPTP